MLYSLFIDLSGLLIALGTRDALSWIMYVMVSLMVSMSSGSCSVSNRFFNSSWNSIFFLYPICVGSALGGLLVVDVFPFHLDAQFDVARNHAVVTSSVVLVHDYLPVTMSACLLGCSQFQPSPHRLGFSISNSSLLSYETWYS